MPQAGGEGAGTVVVQAERLQGDELAQLLRQLAQSVLGKVWNTGTTMSDHHIQSHGWGTSDPTGRVAYEASD